MTKSNISIAALKFIDHLYKLKIDGIVGVGELHLAPCIYFYHKLLSDQQLKQIPALWGDYPIIIK